MSACWSFAGGGNFPRGQKVQAGADFLIGRSTAKRGLVKSIEPRRSESPGRLKTRLRPEPGLVMTRGSFMSVSAWAGTFDTLRRPIVENGTGMSNARNIGIEEIAPDIEIKASPARTVLWSGLRRAGPGLP